MKKTIEFMKKHPIYHAVLHSIGGIGIGIIVANSLAGVHPVRWGVALLGLSLMGHMYAWFAK